MLTTAYCVGVTVIFNDVRAFAFAVDIGVNRARPLSDAMSLSWYLTVARI